MSLKHGHVKHIQKQDIKVYNVQNETVQSSANTPATIPINQIPSTGWLLGFPTSDLCGLLEMLSKMYSPAASRRHHFSKQP